MFQVGDIALRCGRQCEVVECLTQSEIRVRMQDSNAILTVDMSCLQSVHKKKFPSSDSEFSESDESREKAEKLNRQKENPQLKKDIKTRLKTLESLKQKRGNIQRPKKRHIQQATSRKLHSKQKQTEQNQSHGFISKRPHTDRRLSAKLRNLSPQPQSNRKSQPRSKLQRRHSEDLNILRKNDAHLENFQRQLTDEGRHVQTNDDLFKLGRRDVFKQRPKISRSPDRSLEPVRMSKSSDPMYNKSNPTQQIFKCNGDLETSITSSGNHSRSSKSTNPMKYPENAIHIKNLPYVPKLNFEKNSDVGTWMPRSTRVFKSNEG